MAKRPRIDLRVVPFGVGENAGLRGPFLILEFNDQPTLVHLDFRGASGLLEEAPVVRSVKLAWQDLRSMALSPDDSERLIANIAGELT